MDALKKLQDKYKLSIPVVDPEPALAPVPNPEPALAPVPNPEPAVAPVPNPEPRPPAVLRSWRDSTSVCDLHEYLKNLPQITLALRDGTPALHFDPPITLVEFKDNADTLDQACRATELAMAAADDLKSLLSSGLIKLPSLDPVKPKQDKTRNKPRYERKFSDKRKRKNVSL